jgi:membrane associated rhomboid family serine protease
MERFIEKYIRLALAYSLALVFLVEQCTGRMYTGNRILDVFCHANIWHLWLCCFVLWYILRGWPWSSWKMFVMGVVYAVTGAVLSPWPVEGTSGIICAVTAIQLVYAPSRRNVTMVAVSMVLCTIINPLSVVVHMVPFALGLLTAFIVKRYGRTEIR